MNIRKNIDYSGLYAEIDKAIIAGLSQMELYLELGRLVSDRPEKGAAVMAAEYITANYPNRTGFSPRNLRRMRNFYQAYKDYPEILEQAIKIGWTQNIVILEADLDMGGRCWYIRAAYQFEWSKMELNKKIGECAHESTSLDSATDSCYSSTIGGDSDSKEETSGTFLQDLRNEKVQREFQRQRPCGAYLQGLRPTLTRAAGGTDDTSPSGKSAAPSPDRKRNDMAEKPYPRSPARGKVFGLYGLCGTVSSFGAESEKARAVYSNTGIEYRRRNLRPLWRPGLYQRNLSGQPNAAGHYPHTRGWNTADNKSVAPNSNEAIKVDCAFTGDFLVGRRLLQFCRY